MSIKSLHKKRLLKLASFLRNVPSKKFDLAFFVARDYDTDPLPSKEYVKNDFSCGTTGCAIGWCPVVFPKHCRYSTQRIGDIRTHNYVVHKEISYEPTDVWSWAKDFFNLCSSDLFYLFTPDAYRLGHRGPKSVASRIEHFVKLDGNVRHNSKSYQRDYPYDFDD